jgi:hypothetical protein
MQRLSSLRPSRQIVALTLWLAFLGWAIWQHASRTEQPPIYDAASYFQKAHHFWDKVQQKKIFSPFAVAPSFRPPGTVLMSYPFGFEADYRGFYFRSIFLPLALLGAAVAIAGLGWRTAASGNWMLVFFAMYLTSLPAFYFFEFAPKLQSPHYWGMVDFFLSGMAALAAACSIRSINRLSVGWVVAAALASGLCVFIKPSGTLAMALIGAVWFGLALLRIAMLRQDPQALKNGLRWFWRSILIQALVGIGVIGLAFKSAYLSSQNMSYGLSAIGVLKSETTVSWDGAREIVFHLGLGYLFPVVVALMAVFVGARVRRTSPGSAGWSRPMLLALSAASCAVFVFGAWFWLIASGAAYQVRYFFPFLLVAAMYAAPAIAHAGQQMPRWQSIFLALLLLAPAANMAALLAQANPSFEWQRWSGVNLSSQPGDPVTAQARQFVSGLKGEPERVVLYSMTMSAADAAFEAAFDYGRIATPGLPPLAILRPMDWQRPTAFRTQEMLAASRWLFEPVRTPAAVHAILTAPSIDSFDQEQALFQAWATTLTAKEGVAVVSESPAARVLKVTDAARLESALEALLAGRRWRSVFAAANVKKSLSEKDFAALPGPNALENIRFGDHLGDRFHLRSLALARAGEDVTVSVWWQPLPDLKERDWAFFIHLIDGQGKILLNNQIPFYFDGSAQSKDRPIRFDQISFKIPPGNGPRSLAVGLVRPDQGLLLADKGRRDWDNHRVIVPLPD